MGSLVSGIATATGAIFSSDAERGAAQMQRRIAKDNARVADENARLTMAAAEGQEERFGMRNKAIAGTIKAHQGSSGIDINSGSSSAVRESQRELGLFDEMTLKSNAAREAYGFQIKAKGFRDEMEIQKARMKNAKTAGIINTFSSLLGGASSASASYQQWQSVGGDAGGGGKGSGDSSAMLAF